MQNQDRPLYFYVANLGSEVQRVFVWKEKGDKKAIQNSYHRALDIIETIKKFGNQSANKEMEILSQNLEKLIEGKSEFANRNQISTYFNPFALRTLSHNQKRQRPSLPFESVV